jgi:hypothetical protein
MQELEMEKNTLIQKTRTDISKEEERMHKEHNTKIK